ncbi:hypothetical protein FB45DRAFT_889573 [Roridomyces roridus]|uniref:F-box domain-containing protein n=1 Tax=Roridomyces roridus TaxID=1738132 RepID=A0AAD7CKF3_9AGAR|nr:hypothetical protein FB45DRAFT_889573 [Roridomyces roridus]
MRKIIPFSLRPKHFHVFYEFQGFSNDIILVILENCSPHALIQIFMTSKPLNAIILAHPRLWDVVLVNIARGGCPRVPALPTVTASGNYTHRAYIQFIFGGGECSQPQCETVNVANPSHPLVGQPFDFLFRFRSCSKSCKSSIDANLIRQDLIHKYDNADWGKWLPRDLSGDSEPVFFYSELDVADAQAEREQAQIVDSGEVRYDANFPIRSRRQLDQECRRRAHSRDAIQQNAKSLRKWQKLYLAEHQRVNSLNTEFVKKMAVTVSKKASGIQRTPTMSRLLFAFNRDLELLTLTVWTQNRAAILVELESMSQGAFPSEVQLRPEDKIPCPLCSNCRLHRLDSLGAHVIAKCVMRPSVRPKGKAL